VRHPLAAVDGLFDAGRSGDAPRRETAPFEHVGDGFSNARAVNDQFGAGRTAPQQVVHRRDDVVVVHSEWKTLNGADFEDVNHHGNFSNSHDRQASISSLENADAPGSMNSQRYSCANISGPRRFRSLSRKACEIRGQSRAVFFVR
jgi:hypothetical protein